MTAGISRELPIQLAIETTGRSGSAVLMSGEDVLMQRQIGEQIRTAAAIGPVLDEMLAWSRAEKKTIDFVSVAAGPGSFTGLRIGVTAAKMLSYALQLPLVAVDSLASVAAVVFSETPNLEVLRVGLDAYRGQVFTGQFSHGEILPDLTAIPSTWTPCPSSVDIVSGDVWAELLTSADESQVSIAGDSKPFAKYAARLQPRTAVDAFGVGLVALRAARQSMFTDPFALVPRYLRPSAAEEKAAEEKADA
ncbi:tRNA (adenosine(37)-N6)-threonylcarbamoyltransferase complex dimerization subunit type 1 TsaB [Novipirellula sp. SH528]|uniref:tRNA (adenosine(37)-N6)-threonylcarbamoyltransferase complex dimerization subunit type 1 TsaB n=1 Tax=Novipirellula sp. SH528 TaxID=3454466 RepID=UPI003F9EF77C